MPDKLGSEQKQLEANLALLQLDGVDVDVLRNMIVGTPSREGELGVEDGSQTGDFSGMSFISNGNEISVAGGKADVSGISGEISLDGYQYGAAIPDNELFEHNDLTGNYGGDTGAFDIQTGTVYEGDYALSGDGGGSYAAIVRDTAQDPWDRYGLRVTYQMYIDSSANGGGGLAVATSVTGHSSLDGYYFYADKTTDDDFRRLRRVDDGSVTTLEADDSSAITGDAWVDGQVDFLDDGTIEFTIDGVTVSATDQTYESLLLAFHSFAQVYVDNVQFSSI